MDFSLAVMSRCLLLSSCGALASLVLEQGLWSTWASVVVAHGLRSCGCWALEHRFNQCGTQLSCYLVYGILRGEGSNLRLLPWQVDSSTVLPGKSSVVCTTWKFL